MVILNGEVKFWPENRTSRKWPQSEPPTAFQRLKLFVELEGRRGSNFAESKCWQTVA